MPAVSERQRRAMWAAAEGRSTLGIPEKVGKEFVKNDSGMDLCAGILFIYDNKVLLLRRTDRDEWEGPGGHVEDGESLRDAAIRECEEETGIEIDTLERTIAESSGNGIEYTTFFSYPSEKPVPRLNHEHDRAEWFEVNKLPKGVHPGVRKALQSIMTRADCAEFDTELDIAKKIRDGVLKSPQKVGGMWLFDLRVTGTGTSYRAGLGEYVYRPTEHYLSEEFLERCQGLPVIFEHPDKSLLNTEEWRSRGIGTSVLPYIPTQNDETHDTSEVWTIARIYDEDAAELMQTTHISTSPAIRLSPESGSRNVALEGGEKLLIEGKPDLLDHLAIAELGVWDKGGKPRGIANDQTLEK